MRERLIDGSTFGKEPDLIPMPPPADLSTPEKVTALFNRVLACTECAAKDAEIARLKTEAINAAFRAKVFEASAQAAWGQLNAVGIPWEPPPEMAEP